MLKVILKCFKAYCLIDHYFQHGSTSGIATALAHYLLESGSMNGVLVSKKHETYLAYNPEELEDSQGSIYEDFPYKYPCFFVSTIAQVGKPCDMNQCFSFRISLFCSGVLTGKGSVTKQQLRDKSMVSRYLHKSLRRSDKCKHCFDHVGKGSDISLGDSQKDPKLNHVIVWTPEGERVWTSMVEQKKIHAEEIEFGEIMRTQPYLFGNLGPVWIVNKLLRRQP